MQTRSCHENSVCPSVCLSVSQTRALWQNGSRKICLDFMLYERSFMLVFWEEAWLVGANPSTLNFGSTGTPWSEIADFEPIIACSASAVIPSEKSSINTNRKSPMHFPISLRWSSYVAPKSHSGAQKHKTYVTLIKSHFAWRKSATKFIRVKTVSSKVVGHSLT